MYGAIAGDMIGSVYEFNSIKTTEFPLFSRRSHFTDDTVMTVAVAEALMETADLSDLAAVRAAVVKSMQKWGRRYHDAGFGGTFYHWLDKRDPQPYGSFGNGSAMRVSSVGWLADNADQVKELARATADVTHDHPEGVKGPERGVPRGRCGHPGSHRGGHRGGVLRDPGGDREGSQEPAAGGHAVSGGRLHRAEDCADITHRFLFKGKEKRPSRSAAAFSMLQRTAGVILPD